MPNDNLTILDADVVDELVEEWSAEVAKRIRKRRKEMQLTLDEMASLTGLSRQTIHRAEFDAATTRDTARYLIATALARDVVELWAPMSAEQLRRRAKAVA